MSEFAAAAVRHYLAAPTNWSADLVGIFLAKLSCILSQFCRYVA